MKTFVILFLSLISLQSFATSEAYCDAKEGYEIHQSFCEGLDASSCRVHSGLCQLTEYRYEGCGAKPGYEIHDSFCSDMDRQSCRVHSGLCEWSWGGWR